MGLETYHIVIIVAVLFALIMLLGALFKKHRAKKQTIDIRHVSTIQTAYYTPAQYTPYPSTSNNYNNVNGTAPGWSLTNLDVPVTNGINIRQPAVGAVIIQRDPVLHAQGYSSAYEASPIQQQSLEKPPSYNPNYQYSTNK